MFSFQNRLGMQYVVIPGGSNTVDILIPAENKSITVVASLEQIKTSVADWLAGMHIQRAFGKNSSSINHAYLDENQCEFLMTGILADEWDAMFAEN